MVAELSFLAPVTESYKEESERKTEIVTLDLLGGRGDPDPADRTELDLELQVTAGWARRLVPLSAKLYLSPPSPPSDGFLGLKHPPAATTAAAAAPGAYRSVCTLEKVKSALARESLANKRSPSSPSSSSSSSSSASASASAAVTTITTTSSSAKRPKEADKEDGHPRGMAVAACPECLLYVLICKSDPWCPRCAARVAVHGLKKKPRLDLNFTFQAGNHSN